MSRPKPLGRIIRPLHLHKLPAPFHVLVMLDVEGVEMVLCASFVVIRAMGTGAVVASLRGASDVQPFGVVERLQGHPLSRRVGPMPIRLARRLWRDVTGVQG